LQRVILKKGREGPFIRGHPWIFSGAIAALEGDRDGAGPCAVYDSAGQWIAAGLYNPRSQIRVRLLTWKEEAIDKDFLARRLARAARLREETVAPLTNAYRVVNGEGDLLPGLVVDRYGDFLVCQFLTAGMEALRDQVTAALRERFPQAGIYERSEGGVREEEGLEPRTGIVAEPEPPERLAIEEHGLKFWVDIRAGQKTGFFLDQRDNRALVGKLAAGRRVLNAFAYSGAFSAYAARGGAAEVVSVETSRAALELARLNLEANGLAAAGADFVRADAFAYLKRCEREFEMVILDPPSLAPRRADVESAAGGYKFLNLHALRLLRPGGFLLTFSCSQHLSWERFQKIVGGAASDLGRRVQILKKLSPPPDHPVGLHHPEGEYLKGLLLAVLE
jgi:23S rRNA (cytosine1962-C5)-methyltransferase